MQNLIVIYLSTVFNSKISNSSVLCLRWNAYKTQSSIYFYIMHITYKNEVTSSPFISRTTFHSLKYLFSPSTGEVGECL